MSFIGAMPFAGAGEDRVRSLIYDSTGRLHWLGHTQGGQRIGDRSWELRTNSITVLGRITTQGMSEWTRTIESTGEVTGAVLCVDEAGAVYCGGRFQGRAEFGPLPGGVRLESKGEADAFLAAYGPDGTTRWARRFGGTGRSAALALDSKQGWGVVTTGYFEGPGEFDATQVPGRRATQLFVAKHSDTGALEWVRDIHGGESAAGLGIAMDDSGTSYVGGAFMDSTTILPIPLGDPNDGARMEPSRVRTGPKPADLLQPDGFVGAWDAAGNSLWYRTLGGPGSDRVNAVATRGDSVAVAGVIGSGATVGKSVIPKGNGLQWFAACYTRAGSLRWVAYSTGTQFSEAYAVRMDLSGNTYIAGYFNGSPSFGVTQLVTQGTDTFVAKCDPQGNFLWAVQSANTAIVVSETLAVTDDGGIAAVGGYTRGTPRFGMAQFPSVGGRDGFIAPFVSPADPPRLGIARDQRGTFLTWNTNGIGFTLEYRTNLLGHVPWRSFGTGAEWDPTRNEFRYLIPSELDAQFFRLRR